MQICNRIYELNINIKTARSFVLIRRLNQVNNNIPVKIFIKQAQ
jgi:hypothetical protein